MVTFRRTVGGLSLWIFLNIVVFYLIFMVIHVHVSHSGTGILWSFCVESDGMWCGCSTPTKDGDIWEDCGRTESVDLSEHCCVLLDIHGNTCSCILLWDRDPLELLCRV